MFRVVSCILGVVRVGVFYWALAVIVFGSFGVYWGSFKGT